MNSATVSLVAGISGYIACKIYRNFGDQKNRKIYRIASMAADIQHQLDKAKNLNSVGDLNL